MPWFISPSLKNGSRMYRLDSCHVRHGDGRSRAMVWLSMVHSARTPSRPSSGSTRFRSVARVMALPYAIECTAKPLAYFSGSAGSNVTPSKSVSFFTSSRGVSTPMSLATSR